MFILHVTFVEEFKYRLLGRFPFGRIVKPATIHRICSGDYKKGKRLRKLSPELSQLFELSFDTDNPLSMDQVGILAFCSFQISQLQWATKHNLNDETRSDVYHYQEEDSIVRSSNDSYECSV